MKQSLDEPGKYVSHDIEVTGVDPYWLTERKPYAGQAPYTFTHRSFAIRLPTGYDANKPYPLVFQGGGCGSTNGKGGATGGENLVSDADKGNAIAIGMSYVYPDGAGACFADEYENTYEIPYWEAIYKQVTENYCIDLEKVFIGGYSSGAWMAYTTALAKSGKIRGMGAGAGGLREKHPPRSNIPFAAMLITGEGDDTNPVHKTKDGTTCAGSEAQGCWKGEIICGFPGAETCYDTGSAHARDEILKINGCVGTTTQQYDKWPACKQYTGCPAAFPVVYCMPAGGHTKGDDAFNPGIWDFWKKLPAVP
jgi:poly(3-hydroxybutyrate) depolymerase